MSAATARSAPAAGPTAGGKSDRGPSPTRAGLVMVLASMTCVQLGVAVSVGLFDRLGIEGAAWLRLLFAGLLMLGLLRPSRLTTRGLLGGVALGIVTCGVTLLFLVAVSRLPLGTASALEFLGPLGVAIVRGRGGRALLWPGLAAAGVLLLTRPWLGEVDLVGVGFALGAALCWAGYILLTQLVGDELPGVQGLAVSLPVAAVVATLVVGPGTWSELSWSLVPVGIGLALLLPVVPFALEMLALRRLNTSSFGTLMSLEPAIAAAIGLLLLDQVPGVLAAVGVLLVVAAGIGAERSGGREPAPPPVAALDAVTGG